MKMVILIVGIIVAVLVLRSMSTRGGSSPRIHEPPSEENIRRRIAAGQKIQAIKDYRQAHGVGLKEAKEAVEGLERVMRLEGSM